MVEEKLPAGRGPPAASPAGDTKADATPCDPQAPPLCAAELSNSALAHPGISHNAPGNTTRTKAVPNLLPRSKIASRLSSLSVLTSKSKK